MDAAPAPVRGPVRRLLRSRRRRRRLAALAVVAAIAGCVASLVVWVGDTGDTRETFHAGRAQIITQRPMERIEPAELLRIHDIAVQWIETAVERRNVGASWELTHPDLRGDFTRRQWATGEIPAIPYPADTPAAARWRVAYSYHDDVSLAFALLPRHGARVRPATFLVELRAVPAPAGRRWLVSAWVPLSGGQSLIGAGAADSPGPVGAHAAPLSAVWLLVPVGVVSGMLLVPLFLLGRSIVRNRRARRHERELVPLHRYLER